MGKLTKNQRESVCAFLISKRSKQMYPTSVELASALGYSRSYLFNILGKRHQEVTSKFAAAVARHFGMTSEQLFGEAPMILTARLADVPGYWPAEQALKTSAMFPAEGSDFWEQLRGLQADWAYTKISLRELHTIANAFVLAGSFEVDAATD